MPRGDRLMVGTVIAFFLTNFTLTFFALALIVASVAVARSPRPVSRALVVEKYLSWYIFFTIGVTFLYNFVLHSFFGAVAARVIGWQDSPFQFEVGTASLGFAAVGFLAAWRTFDLRLAAVIGPSIFTLGAAAGHIRQMIVAHNFAPGNAGVIFYTDLLLPAVGFVLLGLQHRYGRPAPTR